MKKKIKKIELYNFDDAIANFILPRLITFKKMPRNGYPSQFKTLKEWNKELDKMIYAFDRLVNWKTTKDYYLRYDNPKVIAGLKSFTDNLGGLWD